jgi:hypothetical protein
MASGRAPDIAFIDQALQRLGAVASAPEAHGSLCGLACLLGVRALPAWAGVLFDGAPDQDAIGGEPGAALDELASLTCAALAQGDMSFSPLLPADEEPLASRADGLAEWCAGFMHGLGEAAAGAPPGALRGEITREVMADFSEISRAGVGVSDEGIEGEAAYVELVEFVRVSVQLVFEELHAVRDTLSRPALQ